MDRRHFLKWLGGTAVGVAAAPFLDLDKLLWVEGERKIFLPTLSECVKFTVGDVVTLDGVFAVNPASYRTLPFLQQFVVTADVTSDGKLNDAFPLWPKPISSGIYQNVSKIPMIGQKIKPLYCGDVVSCEVVNG